MRQAGQFDAASIMQLDLFSVCICFVLLPEIWINYGVGDIVADIRAENLNLCDISGSSALDDAMISKKLEGLDTSKPIQLVPLHDTAAVRKIIAVLLAECEKRSHPIPRILADRDVADSIQQALPQGSSVQPLHDTLESPSLVFVAEMEMDGLFGYETVSTRLLRRFGQDEMLAAYTSRRSDVPSPGLDSDGTRIASSFTNRFDIHGIEIVANKAGIVDIKTGHPSETASVSDTFRATALQNVKRHKSAVISTGKYASNTTLSRSLTSLWNCRNAVSDGGLTLLAAECGHGLGSEAMRWYVEGRITSRAMRNPAKYIDGMENLLFLLGMGRDSGILLVSTLPEFYVKRLGMVPVASSSQALDRILQQCGTRRKILVVPDGARTLLHAK